MGRGKTGNKTVGEIFTTSGSTGDLQYIAFKYPPDVAPNMPSGCQPEDSSDSLIPFCSADHPGTRIIGRTRETNAFHNLPNSQEGGIEIGEFLSQANQLRLYHV